MWIPFQKPKNYDPSRSIERTVSLLRHSAPIREAKKQEGLPQSHGEHSTREGGKMAFSKKAKRERKRDVQRHSC